jgi:hypothetical protein
LPRVQGEEGSREKGETKMRVAFCGASGTGKSTLAQFIVDDFEIPLNPIGSRSVAKAMGFDSPYDVDKAGKRTEFQRELIYQKVYWEQTHNDFVTDRTTLDNIVYTIFHEVSAITEEILDVALDGLLMYDVIFLCPMSSFFNLANDPVRKSERTYHRLYETTLLGFLKRYHRGVFYVVDRHDLEDRKRYVLSQINHQP